MCAVSAVSQHYHDKWLIPSAPTWTGLPKRDPQEDMERIRKMLETHKTITRAEYDEYQDLKKKAAEIDAKTNQPECQEAWKKMVDEAVDRYIKQKFGDKD